MDRIFFGAYKDRWDYKLFRDEILKNVHKDTILLDVGAGRGATEWMNFKGTVKEVVGVDPSDVVLKNPYLDKAFVEHGESMRSLQSNQFDVIIANNVLEHVESPDAFLKEIKRVLKENGIFLAKTPNKNHYVSFIARLTSFKFHRFINRKRGVKEEDIFPTFYKLNTVEEQKKAARRSGLALEKVCSYEGRPEYLRIFFLFYIVGWIYERVVNLLKLDAFKVCFISQFRKTNKD